MWFQNARSSHIELENARWAAYVAANAKRTAVSIHMS